MVGCRTTPAELGVNSEDLYSISGKNVKKYFKIEKLNNRYYLISSKYDSVKYIILTDNLNDNLRAHTQINFDNNYEVKYNKNSMIALSSNDRILFNIPSYKYNAKSIDIDGFKPNKIIDVVGITQTTLSRHELTYYYEDENETDAGGGSSTIKCTSGGPGATHCSTNSTIGPVSTGCEVTCESGYYACCDDGRTICKCIKKK